MLLMPGSAINRLIVTEDGHRQLSLVTVLVNAAFLDSVFFVISYLENLLGASAWGAGLRLLESGWRSLR